MPVWQSPRRWQDRRPTNGLGWMAM
jgi:hypothetical protein